MPSPTTTIRTEYDGPIAHIVLDRAARGNGLTRQMIEELAAATRGAAEGGFRAAVRASDEPVGDVGWRS
ncbi:MAG: hypothetical protein JJT89_16945 [Nitriliruptoraceae bacterium]|nr:hypothetical protein [Nitriliruptoraceae bacterium]